MLFGQDWRSALAGRKHGAELAAPLSARRYLIEHGVMHDILSCFTSGASPTILDNDSPWWEALGATGNSDREVSRAFKHRSNLSGNQSNR